MKRFLFGAVLIAAVAGVAYLATLGCCQLIGPRKKPVALSEQLGLSASQRQAVASLERDFLTQRQTACQILMSKRAHLIQLLKQPEPDRAAMSQLVEEIGQEQIALEKATLEHLLTLRQQLDSPQREKLTALVTEQLRNACKYTACGATPGCQVTGTGETD